MCGLCVCICRYVINELIQTERLYVEDLAQIVEVCIVFYCDICQRVAIHDTGPSVARHDQLTHPGLPVSRYPRLANDTQTVII